MRCLLTWMSALMLCGCLGRAKPDLLQARLREQQEHVVEVERRMDATKLELAKARRESEQLRAELAKSGKRIVAAEYTESLVRASKLQINNLLSGGLNRDERPGDDALVAYISLVDDDGEIIKLPGSVQLTLIDPSLPEPSRQIGQWQFTAEECRSKWTRGLTGSGYQFTVKLDHATEHEQLVLNAKMTTADNRIFDATELVRVSPGTLEARARVPLEGGEPLPLDDINDPPPPATSDAGAARLNDFDETWDGPPTRSKVESTNWMKDDFPVRR